MIGEVIKQEVSKPTVENFKEIKPEKGISSKEADGFWKKEFAKEAENAEQENKGKEYFDDNGVKYREGDRLLPETKYEKNGYQYETDDKGRIVSAEGKLRLRDADYEREMEPGVRNYEGQEYKDSDERGHLIGHQFNGSDKLENLVPMDGDLNRTDFAKLENSLADALKDGADVRLKVEPVYNGDSARPTEFRVSYSIDGDREVTVFRNGGEASS